MTEDLWYHALKFLDKYRTDVENYDIEELYQFADKTGILERHRQLLFQPFHESQVDMKIMYYELIKMLIDYERRNHPDSYDATKTVGKIEGYQELTNKLQRYLNQRFIVDIDQLGKQQQSITNIFSGNSDILQKIENLEQNFVSLNEKNQTLLTYVEKVEEANKSLVEEITLLRDKDDEITANLASMKVRHEEFESKHAEDFGLFKDMQAELKQNLEETSKQIERDEKRITELENAGPEITKNLVGELEGRLKELQGNTNNTFNTLEEKINLNIIEIGEGKEEQSQNQEDIRKMTAIQEAVSTQLLEMENKSQESWQGVQEALATNEKDLLQLHSLVEVQVGRMGQVEVEAGVLGGRVDGMKRIADAAGLAVAEVESKVQGQAEAVDSLESELETTKDRLRKNVEAVEGINKTILVFENRHIETVERMREVTILASSVETYVKSEEQRQEQDKARQLAQVTAQLEEVRGEVSAALGRLGRIDEDNLTLLEKLNALDSRLVGLDSRDGQLEGRLGQAASELEARIAVLDAEGGRAREKLQQLEDAYTIQVEKVSYVEALGGRVSVMEEGRQQSEARVKEEVDASLSLKVAAMDQVRADLSSLEDQLQKAKEFFMDTNMKAMEAIRQEHADKEKENEEERKKDQEDVCERVAALNKDVEAMNKKVSTIGKEKDKLKVELDKTVKVSFTTINEMKADLEAENKTEVEALKRKVEESIKDNDEKVVEASTHVINLRELNSKLLEQVKAQMADHGEAQEVMVDGLRTSNKQFLVSFQGQVEREMELIAVQVENNEKEVKRSAEKLEEVTARLGDISKEADKMAEQVEDLETREGAVEVKTERMEKGTEDSARLISELKETISSLDGRHVETVERMREVMVLVGKFEGQTREIGQAFKEDQRKELKGIETQLNTIYTEYEKMEKVVGDLQKDQSQVDMKAVVEQLAEKQQVLEQLGSEQGEALVRTEDKIGKIIESANTLLVSDATKTEKISGLEISWKSLEDKFVGLESADLFLQESHKQLLERATLMESQSHRLEEVVTAQVEEQQRQVEEKLKVQVSALLQDVGGLFTGQETLGGQVEQLQEEMIGKQQRLAKVEMEMPKLKSGLELVEDVKERVVGLKEEVKNLTGGLVSLQFQAEKEEAVVSLASRVDRMDMERQQSEARASELQERAVQENTERLSALQAQVSLLEGQLVGVGQETREACRELAAQIKVLQEEASSLTTTVEGMEPRAMELEKRMVEMQGRIQEKITLLVSQSEEHRSLIERSSSTVAMFSEKFTSYEKEVKENSHSGAQDLDTFKQEVERKMLDLFDTTEDQSSQLEQLNVSLTNVTDQSNRTLEDVVVTQSELQGLKKIMVDDRELIVKRVADQKESSETEVASMLERFEKLESAQDQEISELQLVVKRTESAVEQCAGLEVRVGQVEVSTREQSSLVLAVEKTLTDRLEEINDSVQENFQSSSGELRSLRGELTGDRENIWTLVVEIYSALRGSTLVLKSEGVVKEHQADVLGVYRMVDSYNERPVYKQDGGENYIYYSAASCSWLVGAVVGHQYGWLRNSTQQAGVSRWVPDLTTGWEYRPLVRSSGDSLQSGSWKTDDGSLRIEALRDVDKVSELIRDIKNSREVD